MTEFGETVDGEDGKKKGDTWHLELDEAMVEQLKALGNFGNDFLRDSPRDSGSASSSRKYSRSPDSSTMLLDPPKCSDLARALAEEEKSTVMLSPYQMPPYPYECSTEGSARTSNVSIDQKVSEDFPSPEQTRGNKPTVLLRFSQRYPDVTAVRDDVDIKLPEPIVPNEGSFMGKLKLYGKGAELGPPRVRIDKKETKDKGGTTLIARFDTDEYFRQRINPQ